MDIPELSMAMASSRLHNSVSLALMSKVMDQMEETGEALTEMMEAPMASTPGLGEFVDIVV